MASSVHSSCCKNNLKYQIESFVKNEMDKFYSASNMANSDKRRYYSLYRSNIDNPIIIKKPIQPSLTKTFLMHIYNKAHSYINKWKKSNIVEVNQPVEKSPTVNNGLLSTALVKNSKNSMTTERLPTAQTADVLYQSVKNPCSDKDTFLEITVHPVNKRKKISNHRNCMKKPKDQSLSLRFPIFYPSPQSSKHRHTHHRSSLSASIIKSKKVKHKMKRSIRDVAVKKFSPIPVTSVRTSNYSFRDWLNQIKKSADDKDDNKSTVSISLTTNEKLPMNNGVKLDTSLRSFSSFKSPLILRSVQSISTNCRSRKRMYEHEENTQKQKWKNCSCRLCGSTLNNGSCSCIVQCILNMHHQQQQNINHIS
ncbi:unnamed protein product [Didymodactylos carnosus]|uniref:Uncharacterized protein n=1 Tax=Didymodactylos carnosus TaxID=1234261 RepID=A0A813XWP5_9BILA|nr:unnamed protein product [Didymodactylos carnosus]CAF1118289.1 unnamed protein product [Didymodactylos carnosus]CAF3662769.1 unnamed protein product [Didymodactylos carnosus]CAF3890224.1 unnamed protein product [Didymodactylos carnosus]